MTLFEGLSAFPLTPFDEEGHLKPDVLCRILDRILSAEVDSVGSSAAPVATLILPANSGSGRRGLLGAMSGEERPLSWRRRAAD